MAFQITGVSFVCSPVGTGPDQRKHQSSASLTFVRGIHRWPVNSPHKRPVTRKMFPFYDVIMIYLRHSGTRSTIINWLHIISNELTSLLIHEITWCHLSLGRVFQRIEMFWSTLFWSEFFNVSRCFGQQVLVHEIVGLWINMNWVNEYHNILWRYATLNYGAIMTFMRFDWLKIQQL